MSGGGAGSGGSGPDRPGSGSRGSGGYPPPGSSRAPRQQPPAPQTDRPVSFQTEDRYWTDYLRVILPVVGLLLLLGLFWFWASSLIGDDGDAPATPSQQAIIVTPDTPDPTPTTEAVVTPAETTESESTGDDGSTDAAPTATTEPEDNTDSTDGTYQVDDIITVTDDNVNMRSEPTIDSEVVGQVSAGDELVVTGAAENDGEYDWWPVIDELQDIEGWIREDLLEAS